MAEQAERLVERSLLFDNDMEALNVIENNIAHEPNALDCVKMPFICMACCVGKFECVKKLIELGATEKLDIALVNALSPGFLYKDQQQRDCAKLLLSIGIKVPLVKSVKPQFFRSRERYNYMVVLVKDIRIGMQRAYNAALTLLMCKRFHPKEGVLCFLNMDATRLIARMIYESGMFDWKTWRNKRQSPEKRKRRKIMWGKTKRRN